MAKKGRVLTTFPQPPPETQLAQGLARGIPYYMENQEREYRQQLAKYQEEQRQREQQEAMEYKYAALDASGKKQMFTALKTFLGSDITPEVREKVYGSLPDDAKQQLRDVGTGLAIEASPDIFGTEIKAKAKTQAAEEIRKQQITMQEDRQSQQTEERERRQEFQEGQRIKREQFTAAQAAERAKERATQQELARQEKAAMDTGDYRQLVSHYSQELKRMNDYYAGLEEQKLAESNKTKQHEYAVEQGRVHAIIQGLKKDHEQATQSLRTQTPVTVQSVASKTRQGLDAIPDFEKVYNAWYSTLRPMQKRTVEILLTSKINPMNKEEVYRRYAKRTR